MNMVSILTSIFFFLIFPSQSIMLQNKRQFCSCCGECWLDTHTHTHTHTYLLLIAQQTSRSKISFYLGTTTASRTFSLGFFYDKVLVFNPRAWIQNLILSHQAFTLLCWDSNYVSAEVYTCITSLFNKVKAVTYMNSLVLLKRSWKQFWKIIDQQSISIQGKAMFLFSRVIFLWSAF